MLSDREVRKHRKLLHESDRELAATFKVLGDIHRFRIFRILAEEPPISVSSVAKILDISPPLTSQHIKTLVSAQLVTKTRAGKIVRLQLNAKNPAVAELIRSVRRTLTITNFTRRKSRSKA